MFAFLKSPSYHPLNVLKINAEALRHNYRELQKAHPEAQIAPVLKSNAYGHGLSTVSSIFDQLDAPFLVVDSLYEAYELQKNGVKTPVLILGYTHPDNFKVKKLPFHIAVFDLELAKVLNQYQPHCQIHIFVDTGMHREGVSLDELPAFLNELQKLRNLKVVGLCSHLADADNPSSKNFTVEQIQNFDKAVNLVRSTGFSPQWRHLSASGGAFKVTHPEINLLRVGLASYGINPLEPSDPSFGNIKLEAALEFCSTLIQIKTLKKGESTGYNLTFKAPETMTVGLLPAGYFEGVDRRLSNKGLVTIRGVECPIIGRVSMNMTMIDISHVPDPTVGEEVVIYSSVITAKNSWVNSAKVCETIPYELLVHLDSSIKREIV